MARKQLPKKYSQLLVTGIADKGKGVAREPEGRVIFLDNVVPGDVVDVVVYKKQKSHWLGAVEKYLEYSKDRSQPFCNHFEVCGGCKWQHIQYEAQLRHKQQVVEDALTRLAKLKTDKLMPIIGADQTTFYRNKLEFSFSNKKWLTQEEIVSGTSNLENVLGFHPAGAFDKIIDIEKCWLQPDPSNGIRNTIRAIANHLNFEFYDARAQKGFMRNMIIRVSNLGEVMVIVSFGYDDQHAIHQFFEQLLQQFPNITSLYYCINTKVNDFLLDLEMKLFFGKPTIRELLGHVLFDIGPKSFFQTNTNQAKVLYDTVRSFAALKGTEHLYDLYSGIGSIALYLAKDAKKVVGIEEVDDAVHDARINTSLNGIENAVFYSGDVKDILTDGFVQSHGKADILITDPPRAGMHPKVIDILLKLEVPRIIYVSCNPATQARDFMLLESKYEVEKVQPVDMFPHTQHIETVALLTALKSK